MTWLYLQWRLAYELQSFFNDIVKLVINWAISDSRVKNNYWPGFRPIYLSISIYKYLSIYISISLKCTYLPLSIFIRLSIYLSIYLSINISLYLSIFLLINLYIYLSVSSSYLSIYTYVYEYPGESLLSINLPMLFDQWLKLLTYSCQDTTIYLFIYLSIHPSRSWASA